MAGCQTQTGKNENQATAQVPLAQHKQAKNLVKIVQAEYQAKRQQVVIHTAPVDGGQTGEDILDASSVDGVVNVATTMYPGAHIKRVLLINDNTHQSHTFDVPSELIAPKDSQSALSQKPAEEDAVAVMAGIQLPPRGVHIDPQIQPRAGVGASHQAKVDAVLGVARSKLGRGLCSNGAENRDKRSSLCNAIRKNLHSLDSMVVNHHVQFLLVR